MIFKRGAVFSFPNKKWWAHTIGNISCLIKTLIETSDLNFVISSLVQPRQAGEKKHQSARTRLREKVRVDRNQWCFYIRLASYQMTTESESFLNAHAADGMAVLLRAHEVSGFSELLDPQNCLSHRAAISPGNQTPASHRLVSEPGARWSGSLETQGLTLPGQSAYVQPFQGRSGAASPPACAALMEPGQCHCWKALLLQSRLSLTVSSCQGTQGVYFASGSQVYQYCWKKAGQNFFFLLVYLHFWLPLLMQNRFSLLQKSLLPKTSELLWNEKKKNPKPVPWALQFSRS